MPELPEVQTTVNGINQHTKGLTILDVWTSYNSTFHKGKNNIKDPKYFRSFKKAVIGKTILAADRRAKNVLIHLSGNRTILIHMKMTGHILYGKYKYNKKGSYWRAEEAGPLQHPLNQFIRLVFTLSNKRYLVLSDMRRFAKTTLIETLKLKEHKDIAHLGPEPLDQAFTHNTLYQRLSTRLSGKIKTVIMDQTILTGIGNIYSDEILWRAGINPETRVKDISPKKIKDIFSITRTLLAKGIDLGGDSTSDYHNILGEKGSFQKTHAVYKRKGLPCLKKNCTGIIVRKIIGGRSAHFCPICQK